MSMLGDESCSREGGELHGGGPMSLGVAESALMLEVAMGLMQVYRIFIPYVNDLEASGPSMLGVLR